MTVFYTMCENKSREYLFTRMLGNIIFDDIDISYWAVPGTLED